jgi:hypothetical protein
MLRAAGARFREITARFARLPKNSNAALRASLTLPHGLLPMFPVIEKSTAYIA